MTRYAGVYVLAVLVAVCVVLLILAQKRVKGGGK